MLGIIRKLRELFLSLAFRRREDVCYINGSENLPAPLSPEEEKRYVDMLKNDPGDIRARNALIEHNLRLVVFISKKYDNAAVDQEDLISIGTIGLVKAVGSFDSEKNIKLATYASKCIDNEILMYLRKISGKKSEVSIDEPLNTDKDGNELLLCDVLSTGSDEVSESIEKNEEFAMIRRAVEKLPERDRTIISLRFGIGTGEEKPQKEVADMLNISQSYISRLEKKIIAKLRREITR